MVENHKYIKKLVSNITYYNGSSYSYRLTSVESMDLPDKIEEVSAKILQNYIDEHDYVAVLFCKLTFIP